VADEQNAALMKAAGESGGKDECQVRLKGKERDYWMGTEIGMLRGCQFQGQVAASDGSDKQGKMGAAHNNLRRKRKRQQCKVGREEEGSCSNRPELAAFLLALRDTPIEEPLLYLCDNQLLLKAVSRWIGEGGKATLVGAPDADIHLSFCPVCLNRHLQLLGPETDSLQACLSLCPSSNRVLSLSITLDIRLFLLILRPLSSTLLFARLPRGNPGKPSTRDTLCSLCI